MMRLVRAKCDGHGNGAWSDGEREGERVKSAAKNIVGIHFFLHLRAAIAFLFALEHGPAIGNNDEPAADLHDGNVDSKEMKNMSADEESGDKKEKTVRSELQRH